MSSNLVPNIKKSLEINFKMEFTLYNRRLNRSILLRGLDCVRKKD